MIGAEQGDPCVGAEQPGVGERLAQRLGGRALEIELARAPGADIRGGAADDLGVEVPAHERGVQRVPEERPQAACDDGPELALGQDLLHHPDDIPLGVVEPCGRELVVPGGVQHGGVEVEDDLPTGLGEAHAPVCVVAVDEVPPVPEADLADRRPAGEHGAGADHIDLAEARVLVHALGPADASGPLAVGGLQPVAGVRVVVHQPRGGVEVDCGLDRLRGAVDVDGARADEADRRVGLGGAHEPGAGVRRHAHIVVDQPHVVWPGVAVGGVQEVLDEGEVGVEPAAAAEVGAVADDRERSEAQRVGPGARAGGPELGLVGVVGGVVDDALGVEAFAEELGGAVGRGVVADDDIEVVGREGLCRQIFEHPGDHLLAVPGDKNDRDIGGADRGLKFDLYGRPQAPR